MTSHILQRTFDFVSGKLVRLVVRSALPVVIAGTAVLVVGSGLTVKLVKRRLKIRALAKKRRQKKESCQQAIKALSEKLRNEGQVSVERRQEISGWSLNQLIDKLQAGEVKATEVLETYQLKALEAHKKTNCLIEPIWESEPLALECDLATKKKGPLHGVPFSVKDNYGVEGYDSTIGCAAFIDQPFKEDAVIIQVLKKQGAVPFMKTNVPQTMLSWETTNPIFGKTVNPRDPTRGVGGSSGGEGALLAAHGSLLGFGSDIGGSIRIPAALCGVYGFKATQGRISIQGTHPMNKGQVLVGSCFGPMARDVDSLVTTMRALLVPYMFELDRTVPPMPFNEEVFNSKRPLKIGYYTQDGFFHAVPACERAVYEAKTALQKLGHELIPMTFHDLGQTAMPLWAKVNFGDQGDLIYNILKHDAVDRAMITIYAALSLSVFFRKVLARIIQPLAPNMAAALRAQCGCSSVTEWWALVEEVQNFRRYVREEWRKRQLDALICPGFSCPAIPFGDSAYASGAVSYTSAYNTLNFPAGSMPVTTVTEQDVEDMKNYPVKDPWHSTVKKGMKGSQGLPVGVQVVTLPWQEELCLRVMKELETGLKQ